MNFGYLIVVSQSDQADYAEAAYALALSIKNTQKPGYDQVALVIDDASCLERFKSTWVFDHVVEWSEQSYWDGRSWMDQLSPFENTICLDADMLFLRDYSHSVDYFVENTELYLPNRVYTYRGEIARGDAYRKTFTKNKLPNLYSMYTFFKKDSDTAKEFFSLGRYVIKYPNEFSNLFLTEHKPKVVGTDEAFSLSAKILGISDFISYDLEFPKILHMKGQMQNWPWPGDQVSDHVGFYYNLKNQLKIGNYQQDMIIHYVEKNLMNDEIISILEEKAWKKE
jgi:hypothetical protein